MTVKRFGVSLEEDLLESLDTYVLTNGFSNRSQAIRFLIEKNIAEQKWQCNHVVAGTIIIMFDQTKTDISIKINAIQQNFKDVFAVIISPYLLRKDIGQGVIISDYVKDLKAVVISQNLVVPKQV